MDIVLPDKFVKDYHPINTNNSQLYGGVSAKQTENGKSVGASEESEEIFDDEIQSSSEGSMAEDNLNSARQGSDNQGLDKDIKAADEQQEDMKVTKVIGKNDLHNESEPYEEEDEDQEMQDA